MSKLVRFVNKNDRTLKHPLYPEKESLRCVHCGHVFLDDEYVGHGFLGSHCQTCEEEYNISNKWGS